MRLRKVLITLSIIASLLSGATGVAYSGMMTGHGMGDVVGCPLMGYDAAVCTMNPLEHLSAWQNLFAAIPAQSLVMLLLLLLSLFLALCFSQYLRLLHPSPQPVRIFYNPEASTHDPLRRFIVRGLLHPKIF
ncbi:hypothetical protein HY090_02310 [Candidatus Kaiserbacteria bacterium]|nr:hypothetical protein [Candidatus Kaiserbacteria bacterium]